MQNPITYESLQQDDEFLDNAYFFLKDIIEQP